MMNAPSSRVNLPSRVQAVQRAVGLLKAVAESPSPPTAPELAERCRLNRSTAWRILQTLEDEGLLDRDPQTKRYSTGYEVARLAASGDASLLRGAGPHLKELSGHTGETVSLAVPRRLELIYVEQIQAPHIMAADWLGRTVPLHATSTGKALLAWLPASELDEVLSEPLASFTEATITEPATLREELGQVRRLGYAVSRGELEAPLWGVSAAVLDRGRRPIAVVSVWGAERRLRDRGVTALGDATVATATALAALVTG
jgi:DNA-binding IclR family transcriptional regulator